MNTVKLQVQFNMVSFFYLALKKKRKNCRKELQYYIVCIVGISLGSILTTQHMYSESATIFATFFSLSIIVEKKTEILHLKMNGYTKW